MKTLLTFFVLLFSSAVFAEDISDFQIEGMGIGDSLLDYVSEQQIINNNKNYTFKSNKFYAVDVDNMISMKVYDAIGIFLKTDDKKYVIHSIYGGIFYPNNIDDCYEQKDTIFAELNMMFKDVEINDAGTYDHAGDPYGKSKGTAVWFNFENSGSIGVYCVDWGKEMEKERNYTDHLRVTIESEEYSKWLRTEAY